MKVRQPLSFTDQLDKIDHLKFIQDVARSINGGLDIGQPVDTSINTSGVGPVNVRGNWAKVITPGAPNTEFAVPHNLNYIPVGYDIKRQDKACSVYDGVTAWTKTQIFLKCSVASVTITFFIH